MTDYVVPSRRANRRQPPACAWVPTSVKAPPSCTKASSTSTPAPPGPGMIEGRVSAGVFVGKGSDLGGGCSTMGTLSGGGNIVISVGEGCLIGANAGIGIPLGDRNTVESGLYITAGTKVALLDDQPTTWSRWSRPATWPANRTCCSAATRRPARWSARPTRPRSSSTRRCTPITENRSEAAALGHAALEAGSGCSFTTQ